MGSMSQRVSTECYDEGDHSVTLTAQQNFAQLCKESDAMSVYTRYIFDHTKEQLEKLTQDPHSGLDSGSVSILRNERSIHSTDSAVRRIADESCFLQQKYVS